MPFPTRHRSIRTMPTRLPRHARLHIAAAATTVAVVLLAILIAPTGASAATRDPVVNAIVQARMKRVLTYAEYREARRDWVLAARAQRTARNPSRRKVVADARKRVYGLARTRQLTPDRIKPVMLGIKATTWTMLHGSFPKHEQEVTIPGEVVVFTYYYGSGVQFQPFETFKQGMRELNQAEPDVEAARKIADRMLELKQDRGTSTTWEYFFPWGGPSRPWTSAISQALATEFFWRVGQSVDESERAPYDEVTDRIARSFMRSTRFGGVGVPEGDGRYYVMYSFNPSQRILNGHLQVLINLNRYAAGSGSPVARRVVDLGIKAVLPLLPRFDTGAWSNYQPGQEANLNYHEFQAGQLVKLGDETGDQTLADYGARFTTYTETPPTVTFPSSLYPAIFPAGDGFRDSIDVPLLLDKRAKVTLLVRDEDGDEVARTSISSGRGATKVTWDGTLTNGTRAPAGSYTGRLTATDIAGNRAFVDLEAPLRVIADETAPVMRLLTMRERRGTTIVTVNAFDMGSAWIVARIKVDGKVVAFARGPRAGTINLRTHRPLATVKQGQLLLSDTSGNTFTYDLSS